MKKEKKQNDTNVEQSKQNEIKYPQIASELRGEYTIYTKDKGVYKWNFPYQSKFEDSAELLFALKVAVDKTIEDKKIADAKAEAENKPASENKDKKENYTPVK